VSDPGSGEIVVDVTGLAPGGEAVGRQVGGAHDGRVTFVVLAAPGERVRARLVREKGRVAWAELVAIERPSPERVQPPCPLFGRCGGCQWQHVPRSAQLEAKRRIVERALRTVVTEVRAVGPDYGYRDRARLTVGEGDAEERPVGFRAWRSHDIVDVPACPLLSAPLAAALPRLREEARQREPGTELVVQAGREGVVARVGTRSYQGGLPVEGEALADVAEPGSPPLRIPAGAFAQVGAAANAALVAAVLEQVGPAPGRTLELYAGSGNFTRHLVQRGEVLASDADQSALARGREQVPAARWLEAPRPRDVGPVDTVVADPPREGLDPANLALAILGRRLVYVSCDPQTLGRDAQRLVSAGFALQRVVALDLMPQTYHVEVVATFQRG
jgi:23S rRNA (uracil1939-C5)-methyltransferase